MGETVIGPYRVLEKLGEGGMGEVYRARDTRLNRDVALKLLPARLADDPDRIARLRREAQALAALNHPNIAHVYALEESDGQLALVMELVEGPTIADLLAAHASDSVGLPVDQAIAIARQIADGIEAAHEAGIVHRDLKPSNVKVRDDGTVKVLDFGLAKAADDRLRSGDVAVSPSLPTLTSPAMTAIGVIMGTAAYLAPEQAKGRAADKRADIWAFGCVLWEMLCGTPLFARETMGETLAAILKEDPPVERLPAGVPPALRTLLSRCLERDPKQRLRDIGEARIVLSQSLDTAVPPAPRRRTRLFWPAAAAIATFVALTALAIAWRAPRAPTAAVRRVELPTEIASESFALSPDGQRLAYLAAGHLFVRPLDVLEPVDLGSVPVNAEGVIWSLDGRTIAFAGAGQIFTLPASGGPPFTVCRIPASGKIMGIAWIANDASLVFSVWRDSIYTVAASGGTPQVFLPVNREKEVDFHGITPIADRRLIIQTHQRTSDSDIVEIVDGKARTTLTSDPLVRTFVAVKDHVLFLRSDVNAGLWAAPYAHGTVDFEHATLVQADAIDYDTSLEGTVVAKIPALSMNALVSVDQKGDITQLAGPPIENASGQHLAVSPDGRRVAFLSGARPNTNIFVRDLNTGMDTQLTFSRSSDASKGRWTELLPPTWMPTSDRLLHGVGRIEDFKLVSRRADAASDPHVLISGSYGVPSSDGRTLVFIRDQGGFGLAMRAAFQPDGSVGTPQPVFSGNAKPDVIDLDLSPDGRLLAYAARDESNRIDVYLTDFPGATGSVLAVSGGTRPRFSRSGGTLFFVEGGTSAEAHPYGALKSVTVKAGPPIALGTPTRVVDDSNNGLRLSGYGVAADDRLIVPKRLPPPPGKRERVVLIENWPALLKR